MARAYWVTYGLHTTVTRASNTFGPYQYPEKIAPVFHHPKPLMITRCPLYGDGMQVRDWLYVDDHCDAIDVYSPGRSRQHLQRGRRARNA